MSKYMVVIAREEPCGGSAEHPRLTLHVDTGEPRPRVSGVSVAFSGPGGLTSANLPDIDLAAVVQALASTLVTHGPGSPSTLLEKTSSPEAVQPAPSPAVPPAPVVDRQRLARGSAIAESPESAGADGRRYRKMPDPDELRENLHRIGTVTGLAKYYQVPRHTAQGWVGRLKKLDSRAAGDRPVSESNPAQ
jgi:hypothetical protein